MSKPGPGPALIVATVALLTLIWGTTWAGVRIAVESVPPITAVALRFALAAVLLLPLGKLLGVRYGREKGEIALWILNAAFSFCISYGVVFWAEQWVPSGLGGILFATFPLLVAVMAHFTLPGERLTLRSTAGIVAGFVGVAVIFSEDFKLLGGEQVFVAALVMLIAPVVAAIANVAIKKWGAAIHPISITGVPMAICAVVMGLGAFLFERDLPADYSARSVGALVYLAIAGSAVSFTLYYWLLTHVSATRTSLIAYTSPVVALFIGTVFLDEPLTPLMVAGSLMVVAGIAVTVGWRRWRRPEA